MASARLVRFRLRIHDLCLGVEGLRTLFFFLGGFRKRSPGSISELSSGSLEASWHAKSTLSKIGFSLLAASPR